MSVLLVTVNLEEKNRRALQGVARPGTRVTTLEELGGSLDNVLSDIEVILSAGLRTFTVTSIQRMESLRMVQTLLAGADHLPPEVFGLDVAVCTGSGAGSHDIAEHALALLMVAAKNIVVHTGAIREGVFDRRPVNLPLRQRVLGVLGFGNVGKAVARRGKAFDMKVMAINRSGETTEPVDFIGTLDDLEHVLQDSDYLVITIPLTSKTLGLIGTRELELMKDGAVLVNVARGKVVQERALYEHLRSNPDFRAAFDVWWTYPSGKEGRPYTQPFHELENFIATPHVAGHVSSHREAMMRLAIENIGNFYMGKPLMNRIVEEDFPSQDWSDEDARGQS